MSLLDKKDIIRKDTTIAIDIWKELLLEKFPTEIEYFYAKGSALKPWDSIIDYVPQISDIDIQVKVIESNSSLLLHPSLDISVNINSEYRKRFEKVNNDQNRISYHLPRIQLILINKIVKNLESFVYPRIQDVHILKGKPKFPVQLSYDKIRTIDFANLTNLKETLEIIPLSLLDRTDPFEYYNLLRRMNYIISPSPVRLLTQLLRNENPYDIWTWNRTKIVLMLKYLSLTTIADLYESYYLIAWELYESTFKNIETFLSLIQIGWTFLNNVYLKSLEF